ncbi:glycosyltransferase family 4 protein [Aquibacillus koreensis]|uniref:Glycosyltransferase family 4 protein n=1 Tax=Aquibacillus koreensis TaxID=279446 RepID=A0A9X3WJM5_9BACI|nr:glycosyltransferase family 4 protein [Aquibacillus koreensis]MCT2534636.1 glycosyltransferase family 4 protein [Aquibacillus koreensis]MDC3419820.1 glycosyltransferase family 4 protein [Aquibacillus koreensis]
MKIVHIQQYFNEKMGYQENIFPYYQKKLGHDVVLITSTRSNGFNNDPRVKKEGEFIENGFKVKRINIFNEFKDRFVVFKKLYEYLEAEKPDYIYHHGVNSPSLRTASIYKKNNPNVFLAVDNHSDLNIAARNKLWKVFYYNLLWKNIIAKYDKYIDLYFGVTPARCVFLEEELGINREKIRLLPIGADVDNVKASISKKEFLEKYNIDRNCLLITHGGKITPEKQNDRIIEAFLRLKDRNVRLIIFGLIKDKRVQELIKNDDRIIFLGWLNREDTLTVLKYSDVGIWNTQHTTLLEDCVAVGLPMILRYYGSTCHLIDDTGLFLYDGSIREIQDKLQLIINNDNILNQFKDKAHNIRDLLSYENIAKESIKYYYSTDYNDIHKKFMSIVYSDENYKNFRVMDRS